MTLFEYLTVATSLLLSFGLLRLVGGIPELFRGSKPYWLHIVWVLGLLINYPLMFWQIWSYHVIPEEEWQFFGFMLLLATPASCLFTAYFLIPSYPGEVSDWEQYYYDNRIGVFGSLAMASMFTLYSTFALLNVESDNPSRFLGAGSIAFLLILAYSASRKVHVWMTVGISFVAAGMFIAYRLPSALN